MLWIRMNKQRMNVYETHIFTDLPIDINLQIKSIEYELFNVKLKSPTVPAALMLPKYVVLIETERNLSPKEIVTIEKSLLDESSKFKENIPIFYEDDVKVQYNTISEVYNRYLNFYMVAPEICNYRQTATIDGTIASKRKQIVKSPPPLNMDNNTLMSQSDVTRRRLITLDTYRLRYCRLDKRNTPPDVCIYYHDDILFATQRFPVLFKAIDYTTIIMSMDDLIYNSITPYVGFYRIVENNGQYVYVWVSSAKHILVGSINTPEKDYVTPGVNVGQMPHRLMNYLSRRFNMPFLKNNSPDISLYDNVNDIVVFVGHLPRAVNQIHKERIEALNNE